MTAGINPTRNGRPSHRVTSYSCQVRGDSRSGVRQGRITLEGFDHIDDSHAQHGQRRHDGKEESPEGTGRRRRRGAILVEVPLGTLSARRLVSDMLGSYWLMILLPIPGSVRTPPERQGLLGR